MSIKDKITQKVIQYTLKHSSKLNGGQQIAPVLKSVGVSHVFTLCGGHTAPIYLACEEEGMQVIDHRHEQAAVHAADAYARIQRNLGVAIVTAGPGLTDAITGITNAYFANAPVLVLGGLAPFEEWDRGSLQEMNQLDLVKPITKYARTVTDSTRIAEYTQNAIRYALTPPMGPVYLEIPIDILLEMHKSKEVKSYGQFYIDAPPVASEESINHLYSMIREAESPVMLAGSNIWWDKAESEFREFASQSEMPTFLNGMARGTLPNDHPGFFQHSRKLAFENADLIMIAGTPLDFRLKFGNFNSDAKVVMLDNDGHHIGNNRSVDFAVVGNLAHTYASLTKNIQDVPLQDYSSWLRKIRSVEREKRDKYLSQASSNAKPITHQRLCSELAKFIDEDTIIVGDGGDIVAVGSKILPLTQPGQWMDPGPFGCLGVGPSFAIAAQLLHTDKKVIILHGDGAFGLNGFEFDTAVRFDLPIISVVGNDAGWGQIRNPQVAIMGEDASTATDLAPTRYDKVVESLGGYGEYVESPDEIKPAIQRALDSGKPACVNVMLDPDTLKGGVNLMRGLSI